MINDKLERQLSEDLEDVKVHITHMAEDCAVQTIVYTNSLVVMTYKDGEEQTVDEFAERHWQ